MVLTMAERPLSQKSRVDAPVEVVLRHLLLSLLLRDLLPELPHPLDLAGQLGLGLRLPLLGQRRRRVLPLLPRLHALLQRRSKIEGRDLGNCLLRTTTS